MAELLSTRTKFVNDDGTLNIDAYRLLVNMKGTTDDAVTAIGVNAPLISTGGTTPTLSITPATITDAGSLSAADKIKLNATSGTNTGDQTTISGNAGTASALQTPRAIYGNSFDGSAALTQVIAGTYGGTGSNNGASTITYGGSVTFSGAFTFAGTVTANTAVTFPTTGTLAAQQSSVIVRKQPAPTSKGAAATLTAAEILTGLVQYTGAVANLTLPTGTALDAAITLAVDESFDVVVLNTGAGVATLLTAGGLTLVGAMTVANGASQRFRFRKTAANTFTVYLT